MYVAVLIRFIKMNYLNIVIAFAITLMCLVTKLASNRSPFDDSILYTFKWPGNMQMDSVSEENIMKAVTKDREEYTCVLPHVNFKEEEADLAYEGENGLGLISPLFIHSACAYRFESYWTYEICHGKHVRQYHEERDNKIITTQEYYLGRWDLLKAGDLNDELEQKNVSGLKNKIPTKKIESLTLPYLQVNYTDGTMCDLIDKPRQTNVLYMCYEAGRHDFYSIKEIATCHYELIVLTSLLCVHPKYKPINTIENNINCIPTSDSPKKPKSFLKNEAQVLKREIEKLNEHVSQRLQATSLSISLESLTKDLKATEIIRLELRPTQPKSEMEEISKFLKSPGKKLPDIQKFLLGEECIVGGNGWWQYKFCYGKYVEQFHTDKDNSKTIVRLGEFHFDVHKTWYESNLQKAKKSNSVSHYYSYGDFCELGNVRRAVEVVFRCSDDDYIMLNFMEPRLCVYVLEMESILMCQLLPHTDKHGLFNMPPV